MELLEFNPTTLKDYIEEGTLVSDKGFSSTVFLHGNSLIKLYKRLYQDLKVNSRNLAERRFNDIYRWGKRPFVNPDQIEYLSSIQPHIHLTDFDKGIVKVNDQVCGVILTNHLDYQDLTNIEGNNKKQILTILKNILLSLKELEQNGISHLDLAMAERGKKPTLNVLYKGEDTKLCDLSGKFITYGEDFDPYTMYEEYREVVKILLNKITKLYPEYEDKFFIPDIRTYNEADKMLLDIEKKLIK